MNPNHSSGLRLSPPRTLTYGVLELIGRAIVVEGYDARSFPTEGELAKQHGVSRSVIREAVKMLTAKGLLSARPKQGTIVQPTASWNLFDTDVLRWLLERKFSPELLRHFNQLRLAIEPEAAALAAICADANERRAISAGLERMHAAESGTDSVLDADIAFHIAVLQGSKNPFFVQFQDVVATALRSSIRFTNRINGHAASISDHASVEGAIMRKKPEAARAAMKRIIGDVLELIGTTEQQQRTAAR